MQNCESELWGVKECLYLSVWIIRLCIKGYKLDMLKIASCVTMTQSYWWSLTSFGSLSSRYTYSWVSSAVIYKPVDHIQKAIQTLKCGLLVYFKIQSDVIEEAFNLRCLESDVSWYHTMPHLGNGMIPGFKHSVRVKHVEAS